MNSGSKNREELVRMLVDAGIRPSMQRLAILEYINSCRSHPTGDEVYSHLHGENPTLSRTTVFSNVKLLAEKGVINDIDISSESTRYDYAGNPRHAHFMCRKCRRIFDLPMDLSLLAVPADFSCDNVNVFFKGICPECAGKNETNNKTK
mgnify:CR=1 FL=1